MQEPYREAIDTFTTLLGEANECGDREPTAMSLATAGADGRPSVRTVLLKRAGADGFVFFTNHDSRKARQMQENPRAALVLHWRLVRNQVQVQVEGRVERIADEDSDAYFASRPRMSQIGAWASLQSQTLESREVFERRVADYEREFAGGDVPRPPHWGGYRVVPDLIEFWYGAGFRLHQRDRYECIDGTWRKRMLYP